MLEEVGWLFKGDPTFEYIFNELPRSHFLKIVELRRERVAKQPQFPSLL